MVSSEWEDWVSTFALCPCSPLFKLVTVDIKAPAALKHITPFMASVAKWIFSNMSLRLIYFKCAHSWVSAASASTTTE